MNSLLDEALAAARKDQSRSDAFYELFLKTELIVPTIDIAAGGEDRGFNPVVLDIDGKPHLPAFDSEQRLWAWAKREIPFVGLAAQALVLAIDPALHIALNIETEGFKIFVPDELQWLRQKSGGAAPMKIPEGEQVIISAPKDIPAGLLEALKEHLAHCPEVLAAHMGQTLVVSQGKDPVLALALKLSGSKPTQELMGHISAAIEGRLPADRPMDMMDVGPSGLGCDIAAAVPPFYVPKL